MSKNGQLLRRAVADEDEARVPVSDVLRGLEVHALEEGWTPLEAFVLMKCLDDAGETTWSYRTTHRLNREELLGALMVHVDVLRRELVEEWQ
jgi:hypothetical protein